MENKPKVSVIIPVYNVEKYLRQCLDSICGQTLRDIEIICVDDGSTDATPAILREYAEKDDRFTILTQANAGAGAARNKGLAAAKGEYLSFLDADDFFGKKMLEAAYQTAQSVDADIVVYGADRYIQSENKHIPLASVNYKLLPKEKCFAAADVEKNIFRAVVGWTWDKLFKRSFIAENDITFQEIRIHNDLLFTFAAWASAQRITVIKDVFTHQRKRGGGSISDEFKQWWCTFDALMGLKEYLKTHGLTERFGNDFMNYAVYLLMYNMERMEGQAREQYGELMRTQWLWKLGFFEAPEDVFYNKAELEECKRVAFAGGQGGALPQERVAGPVKVSVLLPVLNSIRYIDECVESILNQTMQEIEVLCIDAGSTDGTLERLKHYESIDPRVRVIHSDIKSYGHQINLGLDAARGEFFGIVESDDYIVADMYQVLYSLAKDNDLDSVKSDFCIFFGDGNDRTFTRRYLTQDRRYYSRVLCPAEDTDLFRANNINPPGIYSLDMIRKHDIRLNETPGASFQDNGLWFFIFVHSRRMMFCARPFYMIRRDNADSSVMSKGKVFCMCDEYDYIRGRLKSLPELAEKYLPLCARYRFSSYEFTCNRIGDEYKLAFLYKYAFDFNKLAQLGELDRHYFSEQQWNKLQQIMGDPFRFYCRRYATAAKAAPEEKSTLGGSQQLKLMKARAEAYKAEIDAIHASWTYRIGRFITWLPRKVRGGIWCFQEHGFGYTAHRVLVHLHLAEDEYKTLPAPAPVRERETDRPRKPAPVKRDYNYYASLPPEKYPEELKLWFKRVTGEDLDLEDPKTFNQKIQWLKLYDSTPIKTRLADKYLVRDWVKEKIGGEYLIPLLGVWDSFDEIDFDKLPDQFVLKANHGCGWNIIVKDKTRFDIDDAKKKFDSWMQANYAYRFGMELHYLNIPPRIIAEKYIEELDQVYDYKVMCFDGKVKFIWVDTDRFTDHKRTVFTLNWERMPVTIKGFAAANHAIPKPVNLDQMIQFAEIMSKGFAHVRVDFYEVGGHLYFGEMTFTSGSGTEKVVPPEFGYEMGSWIKLPPKSPIPERMF